MTGIDRNVLTRYVVQNDGRQAMAAGAFLDSPTKDEPGFIGLVTVADLSWVLTRRYRLSRDPFSGAMNWLINSAQLQFENKVWSLTPCSCLNRPPPISPTVWFRWAPKRLDATRL